MKFLDGYAIVIRPLGCGEVICTIRFYNLWIYTTETLALANTLQRLVVIVANTNVNSALLSMDR